MSIAPFSLVTSLLVFSSFACTGQQSESLSSNNKADDFASCNVETNEGCEGGTCVTDLNSGCNDDNCPGICVEDSDVMDSEPTLDQELQNIVIDNLDLILREVDVAPSTVTVLGCTSAFSMSSDNVIGACLVLGNSNIWVVDVADQVVDGGLFRYPSFSVNMLSETN